MRVAILGLLTLACGSGVRPGSTNRDASDGGAGDASGGVQAGDESMSSGGVGGGAGSTGSGNASGRGTGDHDASPEPAEPPGTRGATGGAAGGAPGNDGTTSSGAGAGDLVDDCPEIEACDTTCAAAIGTPCSTCDIGTFYCGSQQGYYASDGTEYPCDGADCTDAGAAALAHCCSTGAGGTGSGGTGGSSGAIGSGGTGGSSGATVVWSLHQIVIQQDSLCSEPTDVKFSLQIPMGATNCALLEHVADNGWTGTVEMDGSQVLNCFRNQTTGDPTTWPTWGGFGAAGPFLTEARPDWSAAVSWAAEGTLRLIVRRNTHSDSECSGYGDPNYDMLLDFDLEWQLL